VPFSYTAPGETFIDAALITGASLSATTAAAIVVDAVAVAALNEVSAALVAVIEQLPADTAVNVLPETVQTEVVDET
jgi:hypothetical protein